MERIPIQQLPQSLVNRIAAGEVIERPASVVKELVDNSIDAGATHIIVEIEDGGRELVRVIDDGSGIPPVELALAFAPHATSKLQTDEDLFRIQTMGFRGEALASIGSVSHARILSRVASNDEAYELNNRGGELSDLQAAAGNIGTTIEIRNLFFNTPARRKFLKGTQTEFGHITEMVMRLALSQPQISFRVLHNGRVAREYLATTANERLLAAWPDDFREQRLPVQTRDAEMRITGIIGLPELASPTAKYQHLYVNNRPVRDKFIQHALREAYRGLTEPGRHPAAVLLLTLPPGDVDVNVHPTKSEVRFRDSGRIHGLVMSAVREVLLGHDLAPRAVPRFDGGTNVLPVPERIDMQQKLAAFFRPGNERGNESAAQPTSSFAAPPMSYSAGPYSGGSYRDGSYPSASPPVSYPASDHAAPVFLDSPISAYAPHSARHYEQRLPDLPRQIPPGDSSPHESNARTNYPPAPRAGDEVLKSKAIQLHNSYLVVESDEGMLVIDQHALHERIIYEDLLAKVTAGPLESQRMLIPHTIRASSRQLDLLDQIRPMLSKLGIEAEAFGPEAIAIQAFPSFLDRLDPGTFVQELLERGEQELLDLHEEELLHEVLDMMSCKAAVKAGDSLQPEELSELLRQRTQIERSSNCPHGRPTTIRLTVAELERQFKRS
ncbi:MAG: DNA mismatch repair endonuclease MutL [Burkholderiales bacterium]|nr:DNA mismatch repair endonuclease MutL [Phycisphaerae bacterium]